MQVKITPSPLAGTVQLPPSKSFAIRALICSALAGGGSVAPLGTSADIAATVQALADLAAGRDEIFCNESGSLVRFLIPVAAALGKSVTFTGAGRLPRRPLDAFATLLPQVSDDTTRHYLDWLQRLDSEVLRLQAALAGHRQMSRFVFGRFMPGMTTGNSPHH